MRIEIKNVKFYESMSEETHCFQCDIFINGVKAGYAKNEGCGGNTHCQAYDNHRSIFKAGEDYCQTLPDKDFGGGMTWKMNLEDVVDDLFQVWVEAKVQKDFAKKLEKNCKKGICYGSNTSYRIFSWKDYTVETLLRTPHGRDYLKKKIAEMKKKGENILNTNIPQELL